MKRKRGIGFSDCLLAVSFAIVGGFGAVQTIKNAHRYFFAYRERLIAQQLIKQAQLLPLSQLESMHQEDYDRYGLPVQNSGAYSLEITHTLADSTRIHHGSLTYLDLNGAVQTLKFERSTWVDHE